MLQIKRSEGHLHWEISSGKDSSGWERYSVEAYWYSNALDWQPGCEQPQSSVTTQDLKGSQSGKDQ